MYVLLSAYVLILSVLLYIPLVLDQSGGRLIGHRRRREKFLTNSDSPPQPYALSADFNSPVGDAVPSNASSWINDDYTADYSPDDGMSLYSEWSKWSNSVDWNGNPRDLSDYTWTNSWNKPSEQSWSIHQEESRLLILACVFAVVMVVGITIAAKGKCRKCDEAYRTIITTTNINRLTISIPEILRMSPSVTAHRDTDDTSSPLSEAHHGELSGDNISDYDPPTYNDALDTSIYPKSHQQYMYKDDDPLHDLSGSCDLPSYSEATLGYMYTQVPIISDPQEGDLTEPPSYTPEGLDAIRD